MKRVLVVLMVFVIGIIISGIINNEYMNMKKLPVLSPCDVNPDLYDSSLNGRCLGHKIRNFSLLEA